MDVFNPKAFLSRMAEAPAEQVEAVVLPKFKALAEKDVVTAADILRILDECVRFSLCSDFCVTAMNFAWEAVLINENKTVEQGFAEATWRNEPGY